jgi:[ribosomal protein S5]-alanine N-acetyltransferase
MIIETKNLRLISCNIDTLKEAIAGSENLARKLGVTVPDPWTAFGTGPLRHAIDRLSKNKEESNWWGYFPIHKQDNKLIGNGGYKGPPTPDGTVEFGYEITPDYRNRGFATEFAKGLIENAFKDNRVKLLIAHTLGHENPSTNVLRKCGFEKAGEMNDPDDGLIWRWELKRLS